MKLKSMILALSVAGIGLMLSSISINTSTQAQSTADYGDDSQVSTEDSSSADVSPDMPVQDAERQIPVDRASEQPIKVQPIDIQFEADNTREDQPQAEPGLQVAPSQTKVLLLGSTDDNQNADADTAVSIEGDINTTPVKSIYIKIDDIKGEATDSARATGYYIKLGDIKGESTDAERKKSKVEYGWKIEEGEKTTTPENDTVVIVKSADKSSPKLALTACTDGNLICQPNEVRTEADLKEYLERSVNEHDRLNEVRFNDDILELKVNQPAKLLGLIPIKMNHGISIATTATNFGEAKVKLPWWHFLAKKSSNAQDLKAMIETAINDTEISADQETADQEPAESVSLNFESISFNFSKIKAVMHETAMSIIQNIR